MQRSWHVGDRRVKDTEGVKIFCRSWCTIVVQSVAIAVQGAAPRSHGKQLAPLPVCLNLPSGSKACSQAGGRQCRPALYL